MKILLAIAVVTCLFVVGLAQVPSQQCLNRATDLATCLSSTGGDSYCGDCANRLINYYRECANGVGVEAVQRICPNATGGSSTVHTVTALLSALGFTGVALLVF